MPNRIVIDGWLDLDQRTVREIRGSAVVGVYVPGPLAIGESPQVPGEPILSRRMNPGWSDRLDGPIMYELGLATSTCAKQLRRPGRCTACMMIFNRFPSIHDPSERGVRFHNTLHTTFRWRELAPLAQRLDYMLRAIRAVSGAKIMLGATDFACRWVLEIPAPDWLILDSPIIDYREIGPYNRLLGTPSAFRQALIHRLRWWPYWKLGFPIETMLGAREPAVSRLGSWRPLHGTKLARRVIRWRPLGEIVRDLWPEWTGATARSPFPGPCTDGSAPRSDP